MSRLESTLEKQASILDQELFHHKYEFMFKTDLSFAVISSPPILFSSPFPTSFPSPLFSFSLSLSFAVTLSLCLSVSFSLCLCLSLSMLAPEKSFIWPGFFTAWGSQCSHTFPPCQLPLGMKQTLPAEDFAHRRHRIT